jgi:hypothetical protein
VPAGAAINDEALATLVTAALGLQFAAFGWRILREIQLEDEGRRTWFLVTDFLIIFSMSALVANCIVLPLAGQREPLLIARTVATAYIVIAAHPLNTAAHYRLFSRWGRTKYRQQGRDVPYVTDQEWITLALTAACIGWALWIVR